MKTPVVIGVVIALHCAALGTLMMTQGCGNTKGKSGPVQFQDKPAVLPKPAMKDVAPEKVAKPRPKPVETFDESDFDKPVLTEKATKTAPKREVSSTKNYTVKWGDSLGYIAQRFKISINEIKELNPSIKNIAKIRHGQTLKLPGYVNLNAPAPKRHSKPKPVVAPTAPGAAPAFDMGSPVAAPALGAAGEYVVVSGDYPEKIAKKLGVKQADLMAANKITDPKKLKIGQKLVVPAAPQALTPPVPMVPVDMAPLAPYGATSPVPGTAPLAPVPGGGVKEPEGELNPITTLAPSAPAVPAAPAKSLQHTVAPGETLKDVAMLYNVTVADIQRVNKMTAEAVVPGQSLMIPTF
ncbi:MAG: LysM peptidoglycan-binding domain-containing protein [Kiritimatiellia bacterium]